MQKTITKPCRQCGRAMVGVATQRVFCADCIKERDKKRMQEMKSVRCRVSKADRKPYTINEIVRAAEAEYMSYGRFVAKYSL